MSFFNVSVKARTAFYEVCYLHFLAENEDFICLLAEVPGAAWVNLQPAEYLLFCFQKCFLQGGGQTCAKTFLGLVEMSLQNFIRIGAWVWISISPPHTNRQTGKHLYAHLYIYRLLPTRGQRLVSGIEPLTSQSFVRIPSRILHHKDDLIC